MRPDDRLVASVRRAFADVIGVDAIGIDRGPDAVLLRAHTTAPADDELRDQVDVALTEVIADYPEPDRGDPHVTLALAVTEPAWDFLHREAVVLIGRVAWRLTTARPGAAAQVVALSRRLDGTPVIGAGATDAWCEEVRRAAALDAPAVRFTAHQLELPYASIPRRLLPADVAVAAAFLHDLERLATPLFGVTDGTAARPCP